MDVAVGGEALAAVEGRELDEDGDAGDGGAGAGDEFAAGLEGAAGGEEVVDDEDALVLADGVGVNFEAVGAVFEFVADADGFAWELATFSDGDKASGEGLGDGGAEDEAAGFGTDDGGDSHSPVGVGHEFDGEGEGAGVGEHGGKVAELDAGFGEVGDGHDEGFEAADHIVVHGGLLRGRGRRGPARVSEGKDSKIRCGFLPTPGDVGDAKVWVT